MSDDELIRRIVDQVERGIRRDGLTGPAGGTEARRRFNLACPVWEFGSPRENAYRREVERAITRLFAPGVGPVEVETDGAAPLAILPELEAWAESRRVEVRRPVAKEPAKADGPETLDMFAEGSAS